MLLHGTDALKQAAAAGHALPGFVAYNLETVQGITAAAEAAGRPVLIQAGSSPFKHAGRQALMRLALDAAEHSAARLGVHLDHSRDLNEITACLEAGYTSVMVDGSHLPFAENIALTKEAVRRARDHGAWVEAELGALPGDEDVSTDAVAQNEAMTTWTRRPTSWPRRAWTRSPSPSATSTASPSTRSASTWSGWPRSTRPSRSRSSCTAPAVCPSRSCTAPCARRRQGQRQRRTAPRLPGSRPRGPADRAARLRRRLLWAAGRDAVRDTALEVIGRLTPRAEGEARDLSPAPLTPSRTARS